MKLRSETILLSSNLLLVLGEASKFATKMFLYCFIGFMLALSVNGSSEKSPSHLLLNAQLQFDSGNFVRSIELAKIAIKSAEKQNAKSLVLSGLDIIASSQISLNKFNDAEETLNSILQLQQTEKANSVGLAQTYLRLAWLWRSKRNSERSIQFGKKALELSAGNSQIEGEFHLNIGRILYTSGYDASAIIWLEKAETDFENQQTSTSKIETQRFLNLAWLSKSNFQISIRSAEKAVKLSEKTEFKQKHRQALFELGKVLSAAGQTTRAMKIFEKGLNLSKAENDSYQTCKFLSSLTLNYLYIFDSAKADLYLQQLEKFDEKHVFKDDILLSKAIISALRNQKEYSNKLFAELEAMKVVSAFLIPRWKLNIAKRNGDWNEVLEINKEVLRLNLEGNFRDDLPAIYLDFANAYFHLGDSDKSLRYIEKCIAIVEELRQSENSNISLGILDTYHSAYRLLSELKSNNAVESFEFADLLKARQLRDKINNSPTKFAPTISRNTRQKLEELTPQYVNNQSGLETIDQIEKQITTNLPVPTIPKPSLSNLDEISNLKNAAVVSYFFTLDKKLIAYVKESGKQIRMVSLAITETESDQFANSTQQKIKARIFFKKDGKELFDKLLRPLDLSSTHLIIIPDKSLWKIPFQALSSNGESYLIEEKLISYAPSVSVLLEQINGEKPVRQTLRAFANSSFENQNLRFVDVEANGIANIYNSKPMLNATAADFRNNAFDSDILHFSMHAKIDSEQPLDSFLGFRKFGGNSGRLTVNEILDIKLKKGSLVFLASCDTNNILNGEGLVSLAWAMMGSGATSVISSQWEANDRSTEIFTKAFYQDYKKGISAAESYQKASIELIRNKTQNMHEPYYWAAFTLNGDFR